MPVVAAQPTEFGRTLNLLGVMDDGTILLGYGDWNLNTGPIDLLGLDPDTGIVTTLVNDVPTENISEARKLNDGWWWLPSIDPTYQPMWTQDRASLVTNAPAGTWTVLPVTIYGLPPMVHMFGVAQTSDGTLHACGARRIMVSEGNTFNQEYGAAVVWKSTDGGVTWTESLAYLGSGTDGFLRFYGIGQVGDDLLVAASDNTAHFTFHAGTWTQHAGLIPDAGAYGWPVNMDTADRVLIGGTGVRAYGFDGAGELVPDPDLLPLDHTSIILAADEARVVYFTQTSDYTALELRDSDDMDYGSVEAGGWSGALTPAGDVVLCDGVKVYRVETE